MEPTAPIRSAGQSPFQRLRLAWSRAGPFSGRLALASKTVGAILIALFLLRHQPASLRLLGATCTAFLMQCAGSAVGMGSPRYPHWCMVAAGGAMSALILLAVSLDEHPLMQETMLVAVSYLVFLVRRQLPDHATFPLFLFTTTLLAAGIADQTKVRASAAGGLPLWGLLVAFPMYFLIFPRLGVPIPGPGIAARTPYRAALAAVLAIMVEHLIDLPRAYWSILVAVVVTAESRQDLLAKAGDRLVMTIVGCLIGLILHFAAHDIYYLQLAILLVSIFGATYFRTASNRLMVGFLSVYVVFLFAIIGQWDIDIVIIRIYETAIGCAVALVVPMIIPYVDAPVRPLVQSGAAGVPTQR
jgi:hypothetical protein